MIKVKKRTQILKSWWPGSIKGECSTSNVTANVHGVTMSQGVNLLHVHTMILLLCIVSEQSLEVVVNYYYVWKKQNVFHLICHHQDDPDLERIFPL